MKRHLLYPHYLPEVGGNFPPTHTTTEEGILAIGGNLSVNQLCKAYTAGIFPWYGDDTPILWWSPDPRCVLFPVDLHIPQSLKKFIRKKTFTITVNKAFNQVIDSCSTITRPDQNGTWLVNDMLCAYKKFHQHGYAHSVEAWYNNKLVGGLYGINIGSVFFGESMFFTVPNAAKVAFVTFCQWLFAHGCTLIDCQQKTDNLLRFGAITLSRMHFNEILEKNTALPALPFPKPANGQIILDSFLDQNKVL